MQSLLMRRLPVTLVLAMTILLAGCFASKQPMFAPATAVKALGEGGKYATFEIADGKEKPTDKYVVRPRADGAYDFVNEKGAATPVSFHPIAGGLHVAQVKLEGNSGYGYVLFRIAGKDAQVIPAECDQQDQAKLLALGVEIRSKYECHIDKIADPAAFFAGLKYGKSISRMERE